MPKEALIEVDNEFFVLILEEENTNEFHFKKFKLELGKQTEDYVEILNSEVLKDKQIVTKGTNMLLNNGEGGHSH